MKFRVKLTLTIIILLVLAYGVGGSLMISLSFSSAMAREQDNAVQTYKMIVDVLQLADEGAAQTTAYTVTRVLNQLQGGMGAAVRITMGGERIDSGSITLFEHAPVCTEEETCSMAAYAAEDGKHYLLLNALLNKANSFSVDLAFDVSDVYAARQTQQRAYQTTFVLLIAAGAALSWAAAYLLTRPLGALSRASRELANGNLAYRAKVRSRDEVGALARDFNEMAEQLEADVEQLQEAMAVQERFMADFSHEMKTPMTSIIGYADLLRSQVLSPSEQMDAANYIFSEGRRLESLSLKLLDMLSLGRSGLKLVPSSPAALVSGVAEHLKTVYVRQNIQIQYRCTEGVCLLEPDLVKTLLVNLLDNARKALDAGGNIYVLQEMLPDGCRIRVLDNGRGIPPEALSHLTEAFYRVDKSRSRAQGGAGLGLSLCNEIVHLHGGTMQFESRVGNGTVVTVELKGGRA